MVRFKPASQAKQGKGRRQKETHKRIERLKEKSFKIITTNGKTVKQTIPVVSQEEI
jgi:hypothetical protein